jgi:hypothetical protein
LELISSEKQELSEAVFLGERKRLLSLAYGILGSLSEAEDVVQEAYLRSTPLPASRSEIRKRYGELYTFSQITINSEPGMVARSDGRATGVTAFAAEDGLITAIYFISNPDKLRLLREAFG